MTHADLVRSDFGSKSQKLVGRAYLIGEAIKVVTDDEDLERVLREPMYDPRSATCIEPSNGSAYLELLARKWDGSYALVTPVHEDDDCVFLHAASAPIASTDLTVT